LTRLSAVAALATVCLMAAGCRAVRCGDGCECRCGGGASLAFAKYDFSCDNACGGCCGACGGESCDCATPCGCDNAEGGCAKDCRRSWMNRLCGCTGCGELYWSEWHNHPPARCEPCDCLGNYVGPGSPGFYRAPYRRHDAFAQDESPATASALELADSGDEVEEEIDE
jgi:hypothetical protein